MTHDILLAEAKAALLWSANGGTWSAKLTPEQSAAVLAELQKMEIPTGTVDHRPPIEKNYEFYRGEDDEHYAAPA